MRNIRTQHFNLRLTAEDDISNTFKDYRLVMNGDNAADSAVGYSNIQLIDQALHNEDARLEGVEEMRAPQLCVEAAPYANGRIDASSGAQTSTSYVYSRVMENDVGLYYFDDANYDLCFVYWDDETVATNLSAGRKTVSSWMTESPAQSLSVTANRRYMRLELRNKGGANAAIDPTGVRIYTWKAGDEAKIVTKINSIGEIVGEGRVYALGTATSGSYYSESGGSISTTTGTGKLFPAIDLSDSVGKKVRVKYTTSNTTSTRMTALCNSSGAIAKAYAENEMDDFGFIFDVTASNKYLYVSASADASDFQISETGGLVMDVREMREQLSQMDGVVEAAEEVGYINVPLTTYTSGQCYTVGNDGVVSAITQSSSRRYEPIDLTDYIGKTVIVRCKATPGNTSTRCMALCDSSGNALTYFKELQLTGHGFRFRPNATYKYLYISHSTSASDLSVRAVSGMSEDIALLQVPVCYVDGSVNTSGNGTDSSPYKTIQEAVYYGAEYIKVKAADENGDTIEYAPFKVSGRQEPLKIMLWEVPASGAEPKIHITVASGSTLNGIYVENCSDVELYDIKVHDIDGHCFRIVNVNHFEATRCIADTNAIVTSDSGVSSTFSGFSLSNVNGVFRDCLAINVTLDGFNIHGDGDTQFINCVAHGCGDDGISHHNNCTGLILGGEYYNNGKAGVASPYSGATVDMIGVYSHDNVQYGIYSSSESGSDATSKGRIVNCVVTDNPVDIYVAYSTLTGWSNTYTTLEKGEDGDYIDIGSGDEAADGNNDVITQNTLDAFAERKGGLGTSTATNKMVINVNVNYKHKAIPVKPGQNLYLRANDNYPAIFAGVKTYSIPETEGLLDISDYPGWETVISVAAGNEFSAAIPDDVHYIVIVTINGKITGTDTLKETTPQAFLIDKFAIRHLFMGDSITEGYWSQDGDEEGVESHCDAKRSYSAWMTSQTGFVATNKGVGGAGWVKHGSGSSHAKLNARTQLDALAADGTYDIDLTKYDLLTVMFGVNDWKGSSSFGTFNANDEITDNIYTAVTTPASDAIPVYTSWYEKRTVGQNEEYYASSDLSVYGPYYLLFTKQIKNPSGDPNANGYYELFDTTYFLSSDTEVDDTKTYYYLVAMQRAYGDIYKNVNGTIVEQSPSGLGWYTRSGTSYTPASEATPQANGKTYYSMKYALPVTPVGSENPQSLGWYEKGLNGYTLSSDTTANASKTYYTASNETVVLNMRYFIETAMSRNPALKLIIITPLNCCLYGTAAENYGIGYQVNGKTLEDMYTTIKTVCSYYGIQMIDMLHSSVINRANIAGMLKDKVHPSLNAHRLIGLELAWKIG